MAKTFKLDSMNSLMGLIFIVFLCQCSQKHSVIPTEPLFLQAPSRERVRFASEESFIQKTPEKPRQIHGPQYLKIHRLWNEDKNEEALKLSSELIDSSLFKKQSDSVQAAHHELQFQIAYDLQDLLSARKAYDSLESLAPCSKKHRSHQLSLALLYYASKKNLEATEVLQKQNCSEGKKQNRSVQQAYWLYRFSEGFPSKQKSYLKDLESLSPVPQFYTVAATLLEGRVIGPFDSLPSFYGDFPERVRVTPAISRAIKQAEDKIKQKDQGGAIESLYQAKSEIFKSKHQYPETLLYISRLFQAAGEHLESMKIVNQMVAHDSVELVQSEWLGTFHRPFEEDVIPLCDRWGVDPDLVYSLIRQESAFNPGAHSIAGARGLVQLMPGLAKFILSQWRVPLPADKNYLYQAKANLPLAIYHLHQLQQVFSHPALIAAAYNAGVQRVNQWNQRFGHFPLDLFTEFVPVKETRDYIKYVMRNLWIYKKIKRPTPYSKSYQSASRGDKLCLALGGDLTGTPCIQ